MLFNLKHIFTPLAIVKTRRITGVQTFIDARELFVFGVRLAYWTCDTT